MNKLHVLVAAAPGVVLAAAALAQEPPHHYTARPVPPEQMPPILPPAEPGDPGDPRTPGGLPDFDWNTLDNGGGPLSSGSTLLEGTVGQPDAGKMSNGATEFVGGFWALDLDSPCYANCDESTQPPALNILDFTCFLTKYAAGDPYANCDGSTQPPVLNVQDFSCFLTRYSQGCP
jgi:hypothetical protein